MKEFKVLDSRGFWPLRFVLKCVPVLPFTVW